MNTKNIIGVIILALVLGLALWITNPRPQFSTNPSSLHITSTTSDMNVELGNAQKITWDSENYSPKNIEINIIKKVGSSPDRYELVRSLKGDISNDGTATWIPALSDIGNNIYVEVACAMTKVACTSSLSQGSLAVINSTRYMNTASAFDSIEQLENR